MANKPAASTKKAPARKSAAAKTTVRTIRADDKSAKVVKPAPAVPKTVVRPASTPAVRREKTSLPANIVSVVLAELLGTFILTLVAVLPFSSGFSGVSSVLAALAVGLTVSVLVVAIGAISGAHLNPAVSFALWTMRRLRGLLLPFYWGAQLLGAMLAVIVINLVSNNSLSLNFNHIWNFNWNIFGIEMIATAVFLFGLVASLSRRDLTVGVRALGIGASLALGVIVSSTLLSAAMTDAVATYQKDYQTAQQDDKNPKQPDFPQIAYIRGATLNPAVALASTEKTNSEISSSSAGEAETTYSRFTLEVILGTLIGAAVGGNLYLLVAGRTRND